MRINFILGDFWEWESSKGFLDHLRPRWRLLPSTHHSHALGIVKESFPTLLHNRHALSGVFRPTASLGFSLEQQLVNTTSYPIKQSRSLRPNTEQEQVTAEIFYCGLCFENQVKNYGFAWFKRCWQVPAISVCTTHRVFLRTSICGNCSWRMGSYDEFREVLYGVCPNCCSSLWQMMSESPSCQTLTLARWFG